jgi:hypothetical protein
MSAPWMTGLRGDGGGDEGASISVGDVGVISRHLLSRLSGRGGGDARFVRPM